MRLSSDDCWRPCASDSGGRAGRRPLEPPWTFTLDVTAVEAMVGVLWPVSLVALVAAILRIRAAFREVEEDSDSSEPVSD